MMKRHCKRKGKIQFLILNKSQDWILDIFCYWVSPLLSFFLPILCKDVTMDRYDRGQLLNLFLKMRQNFTYYYYYYYYYYNFTYLVSD